MKAVIFAVDPKSTSRSLMYLFLHQCRLTCPHCRGVPPREQDVHPPLADPMYRLLICLFPILWHPEETAAQTRSSTPSPPAYSALPFSCLLPATKALPLPDVSLYAGPRVYVFTVFFYTHQGFFSDRIRIILYIGSKAEF